MAGFCCCLPPSRGPSLQSPPGPIEDTTERPLEPPCSRNSIRSQSEIQPRQIQPQIASGNSCSGIPIALGVPTELDELVVDDSESECNQARLARKTSSVLDVIRTRLIRQSPSERETIQRPRIFPGNSENEVARRAELRRLRQQRIQEELDGASNQEDQSIASSHRNTPCFSSLTSLTNHGGPRDTIEFLVLDKNMSSPVEHSTKTSFKSSDTFNGRKTAPLQSPSYDSLLPSANFQQAPNNNNRMGQCEDQNDKVIPQVPCLTNSPTSPQLDLALPSYQISNRAEQSSEDYQSALNTWLMAQKLSSSESPGISTDDSDGKEFTMPMHSSPSPEHQKDNVLEDLSADLSVIIKNLSDDRISKESDKMSTISEISLRKTAGAASNVDIEEQGQANYKDIPVLEKSSSQDLAESYAAALAFNSQLDNGSSNYNSVRPSFQPSPVRSYINLHHLDPQELNSVTWIPFRCELFLICNTGLLSWI